MRTMHERDDAARALLLSTDPRQCAHFGDLESSNTGAPRTGLRCSKLAHSRARRIAEVFIYKKDIRQHLNLHS